MRKVRREVVKTCNEYRAKWKGGVPAVYTDVFTNHAANEYAKFLLTEEHNDDSLQQICEHHKIVGTNRAIVGFSYLDDDHDASDLTKMNEFMDAHGLLLELQEDMEQITNKDYTHIGVGFAANKQMVKIVELLSSRPVMINNMGPTEDGGIEVQGLNLHPATAGLYAARIINPAVPGKHFGLVGPSGIDIDPATHKFVIKFPDTGNPDDIFYHADQKVLEIYVRRAQIDKIKYGANADPAEKIKVDQLECVMRLPMEFVPDPRTVIEDEQDAKMFEREAEERAARAEEEVLIKLAQEAARKEEK